MLSINTNSKLQGGLEEVDMDRVNEQQGFQGDSSIDSLAELIDVLVDRYSTQNRVLWFRGQRKSRWNVEPKIWRDPPGLQAEEQNYTNRFRARAAIRRSNLPTFRDYGPWLSIMQHYGLPTRLLDWSRSPLVALYFALESLIYKAGNTPSSDDAVDSAAIWILVPSLLNWLEVGEEITPPIEAEMCREMLRPAFTSNAEENSKVCAAMSSENDMRMFVQQGCFTIHSDRTPLNEKAECERYLTKLTIPGDSLKRIALEVDVCGLRKGDLFPDLAELASEMTSWDVSDLVEDYYRRRG
jgi:hypothetical protein